jgi:hypothetical protein
MYFPSIRLHCQLVILTLLHALELSPLYCISKRISKSIRQSRCPQTIRTWLCFCVSCWQLGGILRREWNCDMFCLRKPATPDKREIWRRRVRYPSKTFFAVSPFPLCFKCCVIPGDLFGMWEDVLYCRLHFELVAATYGPHGDPLDLPPSLQSPTGKSF